MQTGLFIRGGMVRQDPWGQLFPTDPEFPIRERHTAYEWAMALGADEHPYAHRIADLYGSKGDLEAKTIAGMQARERAVEGWVSKTEPEELQPRAIYYALKAEFDAGRLEPLRREWCIDRPGIDPPNVVDFSRFVFEIEQVLPLIRRRGDTGRLIGELLAATEGTAIPRPELTGEASKRTVSAADLRAAIEAYGNAPEKNLLEYAIQKFPTKRVPRRLLREERTAVFGKPQPGRPKAT